MTPLSLLLLLLATTTVATTTAATATDLVEKTCKDASKSSPNINYTFCYNALHSSSAATNGADLTRLGLIAITLVKSNCTGTNTLIKRLLEANNKRTRAALNDCSELYSDAISTLSESARDYKGKRFGEANVKVSAVMDSATTCEQGFEDLKVASPLSKQNSHTFQLCAIALSIINMVAHH